MWHQMNGYRILILAAIAAAGIWRWDSADVSGHRRTRFCRQHELRRPTCCGANFPDVLLDALRVRPVVVLNSSRDPFAFQQHVSVAVEAAGPRRADHAALPRSRVPVPPTPVTPIKFIGSLEWRSDTLGDLLRLRRIYGCRPAGRVVLGEMEGTQDRRGVGAGRTKWRRSHEDPDDRVRAVERTCTPGVPQAYDGRGSVTVTLRARRACPTYDGAARHRPEYRRTAARERGDGSSARRRTASIHAVYRSDSRRLYILKPE